MDEERLVEIIGESLMMGEDRRQLIERLSGHGVAVTPELDSRIERISADPLARAGRNLGLRLRKRNWLLETLFRLADEAGYVTKVPRHTDVSSEEFFFEYYGRNIPIVLAGAIADWPAVSRWTPDYLKARIGDRIVQVQSDRNSNPDFELYKDRHARELPFSAYMDLITAEGSNNNFYMTAYNSPRNEAAMSCIREDMGTIDRYLDPGADNRYGLPWIGPAGTITPMHHDLTNNMLAQVAGRKVVKLVPSIQADAMYNDVHVFSAVSDIESPGFDIERFPRFARSRVLDVTLLPGDVLFIPIGWWHQVRSLDFSVTVTFTNFLRNNTFHESYPS